VGISSGWSAVNSRFSDHDLFCVNYVLAYPRFWLWYFVLSVVLALAGLFSFVAESTGAQQSSGPLGIVLQWAMLWPLYGYARQVRISPRWLWLIAFSIGAFSMVLAVVAVAFVSISESEPMLVVHLLATLLYAGPALFGVHQYLFRSPHIWSGSGASG